MQYSKFLRRKQLTLELKETCMNRRGRTIKLFDRFTESFLLNHKIIELLAESSEYIGAFQPTDFN
ncbi:unnamed protein product, partial [Rhizophagus irregularis]